MLTRDGHCTEGIEALRVGRVRVALADRFPAVPFGGSNSFIHSAAIRLPRRADISSGGSGQHGRASLSLSGTYSLTRTL